ncbi:MAG: hypothetical protein CME70_23530 [Halobacteriovorax sp.]|nr:hypothetical protein [Halobacteriovorax sp.]
MRVYSSTLNAFTSRLKAETKKILIEEMGFSVKRSRFLFKNYLYPFSLVAFESKNKLGYFNPDNFQIGINKNLVYMAKPEVLKNILRHELAHMSVHLKYGEEVSAHGVEFREACKSYGWGKDVYGAYGDLQKENSLSSAPEFEKILSKVQKLLKLANSANTHEATLATAKANELLMKYNLEHIDDEARENEEVYVKNIYEAKRSNVQMSALYEILENFYVQPVLNRGQSKAYLEVIGSKTNVEMADYMAKYLVAEFERLYKLSGLKGSAAKNSFIRGIAEGYTQKIKAKQKEHPNYKNELIRLDKVLKSQVQLVYSRMGSSSSSASKNDYEARAMGRAAGGSLSINKGLEKSSGPKRIGFKS